MHSKFNNSKISFGDSVRVLSTDLTRSIGLAGLVGTCYGQTIPSSSGVDGIIGDSEDDYAINVFFDERDETFWFKENLLEFVDHDKVTEIKIDGLNGYRF